MNLSTRELWRPDAQFRAAWTASLRRVVEGENAVVRTSQSAEELVGYMMENAERYDVRPALAELRVNQPCSSAHEPTARRLSRSITNRSVTPSRA
jgi:hypothetical protein